MMDKREAYRVILLLGVVSLLGDVVYEGSRGTIPEYFRYLGASAAVVGAITGVGDLLVYFSRFLGGYLADRTRGYWALIFLGYGLILAIPLIPLSEILGLGWALAAAVWLLERFGKGIRTPSRDTMISFAAESVGGGKAFGIHELMDQVGATLGPLFFAASIALFRNYRDAFFLSAVPYALLMAALVYTKSRVKLPAGIASLGKRESSEPRSLSKRAKAYIAAAGVNALGLFPVSLILYILTETPEVNALGAWFPPALYAAVQLVDAVAALALGLLYDRFKLNVLFLPFSLSILIPFFALQRGFAPVVISALLFGLVLGSQESVYRAAVGDLTDPSVRATAYGFFGGALGLGAMAAGYLYGLMVDLNAPLWLGSLYVIATQAVSLALLLYVVKTR